jgi:hypothetical protein
VTAQQYDAWYGTPRGAWIGETEYRLLCRLLARVAEAALSRRIPFGAFLAVCADARPTAKPPTRPASLYSPLFKAAA